MKYLPLFFLMLMLVTGGCNPIEEEKDVIRFSEKEIPSPILLKGKKYAYPQIINPKGLLISKNFAIIFERKNINDDKLHFIDLQNESYYQSKGIDGLGPGELSVISQIDILQEENKVMVYDPELNLFSKFDMLDSNKLAEKQFRAPEISHFITTATFTSDTTILATAVDGWTRYLHLTLNGDTLGLFGDWKEMIRGVDIPNNYSEEYLEANLISNLFQGILKVNKSHTYAVNAGIKADFIEIIRLKDFQIKTVYGPGPTLQNFKITYSGNYQMPSYPQETSTTRYADVFAGEKTFFALFRGKAYKYISESTNLNKLFEFDYEGNLLRCYQLDAPIFGFSVDEDNKSIYGVTIDAEPNLIRFDY